MRESISVTTNVKILGLTFSSDLSWYSHIDKIINACKKDTHAIKLLSQYLDIDDLTKIVHSKVLYKLWYAAPVWLSKKSFQAKRNISSRLSCKR